MHTKEVKSVIQHFLERGTLRALQVAAMLSRPSVNLDKVTASSLHHLALACKRLSLHCSGSCPPLPSFHLLAWVRLLEQLDA